MTQTTEPESEPKWLAVSVVQAIHNRALVEFGGAAGVRDEGLLESVLARPKRLYHYGAGVTFYHLAASYCLGIVRNQPFIDGNKRTGFIAARVFLLLNGIDFAPAQGEPARVIRALAAGEMTEPELVEWCERNSTPAL